MFDSVCPRLLLLAAIVYTGNCCMSGGNAGGGNSGGGGNPPNPTTVPPVTGGPGPDQGGALEKHLGITPDQTSDFDDTQFIQKGGGPVQQGDDLYCDFDGGDDCCWANSQPPADSLDWRHSVARPDSEKFARSFDQPPGLETAPVNGYLLVHTPKKAVPFAEAKFISCSIECAAGEISVTSRHWTTQNVLLQVCSQSTFVEPGEEQPLLDCQELPRIVSPGPTTVRLPPGKLIDVVFVASNFVGADGDVAMLDELMVGYEPCTSLPDENCGSLECDFDGSDLCGYKDTALNGNVDTGATKSFENVGGRFKNRVTGVPGPFTDGGRYVATYLLPGEVASLESGELFLSEDRVLSFADYEATFGIVFKVCLDGSSNCPFKTDPEVTVADRKWEENRVVIPAATKKIVMIAENMGTNQGAAGVDNVQLLLGEVNEPPFGPACEETQALYEDDDAFDVSFRSSVNRNRKTAFKQRKAFSHRTKNVQREMSPAMKLRRMIGLRAQSSRKTTTAKPTRNKPRREQSQLFWQGMPFNFQFQNSAKQFLRMQ